MSAPSPLSSEEATDAAHWLSLSRVCVANGDDLVQDARLLLEHGRASRALSLSVLAAEEYGKAMQALLVIGAGGSASEKRAYQQLHGLHRPKLEAIVAWLAILDPAEQLDASFVERAQLEVQMMATAKMAGFYVDRTDTGVVAPSQTPADQARRYLTLAEVAGAQLRQLLGVIVGDQELHALWRHAPQVSKAVAAAVEGADDDGSAVVNELRNLLPNFGLQLVARPETGQPRLR